MQFEKEKPLKLHIKFKLNNNKKIKKIIRFLNQFYIR